MKVHVHIDRLVVDEMPGLDSRALDKAVREGLVGALARRFDLPLLRREGHFEALHDAAVRMPPHATWGEEVGRAIHDALSAGAAPRQTRQPPGSER